MADSGPFIPIVSGPPGGQLASKPRAVARRRWSLDEKQFRSKIGGRCRMVGGGARPVGRREKNRIPIADISPAASVPQS
jgi:hypothetical protein